MILFKKDSLSKNVPSRDTYVSKGHGIYINGKLVRAWKLINKKTIVRKVRGHEIIYNVLLKEHSKMRVNNMTVETLDPNHKIAKIYL